MVAIYTLASALHDAKAVDAAARSFLDSLGIEYSLKGDDFSDYGSELSLICILTGGTEGLFKEVLPVIKGLSRQRIFLLASGRSNSLAASMEIMSYLRQNGLRGEILHGSPAYIRSRIESVAKVEDARRSLEFTTVGVIGAPSDWLIASQADPEAVYDRLGVNVESIPMEELMDEYSSLEDVGDRALEGLPDPCGEIPSVVRASLPGADRIYRALRNLAAKRGLSGLTVRCFDLLTSVHNTGCLALARLNSEGIVAGCEGDIPALLSMIVGKSVSGRSGFQANPSCMDLESGEFVFSHCTVPLDMVSSFSLDTHFESGIGVGIHGELPLGPVTVFKVSGDLSRHFACEGELLRNEYSRDLCRTQVVLRLPDQAFRYFLTDPIGNHHVIFPGHCAAALEELLK